jgi:multiple sugar transport system permease protein
MSTLTTPTRVTDDAFAPPSALRRSRRKGTLTRRPLTGMLFVAPAAVIVIGLFILPLVVLVVMSFMDWPLLGSPTPNGVENYSDIATNERFLGAIAFTLLYTVITTVILFAVSFVLVAISNSSRRGAKFYRTAFFLPYVVGTAAAALMWFVDINEQVGVFNLLLQTFGITDGPISFLETPSRALYTVIGLVVWKFIGFQVIVMLVGLQSVPVELYEAARVDGASTAQRLRYITLPYLKPTLALLFMLSITGSLLAFDQFFILTKGGPDNSTITMVMAVYNTAFTSFDLGRAAALAVVLLIALVVLNVVQLRILRPKDES